MNVIAYSLFIAHYIRPECSVSHVDSFINLFYSWSEKSTPIKWTRQKVSFELRSPFFSSQVIDYTTQGNTILFSLCSSGARNGEISHMSYAYQASAAPWRTSHELPINGDFRKDYCTWGRHLWLGGWEKWRLLTIMCLFKALPVGQDGFLIGIAMFCWYALRTEHGVLSPSGCHVCHF